MPATAFVMHTHTHSAHPCGGIKIEVKDELPEQVLEVARIITISRWGRERPPQEVNYSRKRWHSTLRHAGLMLIGHDLGLKK